MNVQKFFFSFIPGLRNILLKCQMYIEDSVTTPLFCPKGDPPTTPFGYIITAEYILVRIGCSQVCANTMYNLVCRT